MLLCNVELWNGLNNRLKLEDGIEVKTALSKCCIYRKEAMLYAAKHNCQENVLYFVIQHDEMMDTITTISYFRNTFVSDDEINNLFRRFPDAEFGIIYAKYHKTLCHTILEEERSKHIAPITLKDANAFVVANHRHHDSVTGCKFAIGLYKTVNGVDTLIGTAICGRPVSRYLDDGLTLEINRLCTIDDESNGCSMLYGACSRIAREMGYKKIITYILESESGISLRASNFLLENEYCGGKVWTGTRKNKKQKTPEEMKQRWVKML